MRPYQWLHATTVFFMSMFLACGGNTVNAQGSIPASLEYGADSTTLVFKYGTTSEPAKNIYGLEILFEADFSNLPVSEISIDLDCGWFCPGNAGSDYSWSVNSAESEAILTIWDLDSAVCTGDGVFMELHRSSGFGNLLLGDILKTGPPIKVKTLQKNASKLLIYPNPAPAGTFRTVMGTAPGTRLELYDGQGRLLQHMSCEGEQAEISIAHRGTYLLLLRETQSRTVLGRKTILVH